MNLLCFNLKNFMMRAIKNLDSQKLLWFKIRSWWRPGPRRLNTAILTKKNKLYKCIYVKLNKRVFKYSCPKLLKKISKEWIEHFCVFLLLRVKSQDTRNRGFWACFVALGLTARSIRAFDLQDGVNFVEAHQAPHPKIEN